MLAIGRPHGRTAHGARVAALRQLHDAGIITFRRTEMIGNRRHYVITQPGVDEELLLRDSDIEPYLIGMQALAKALTGTVFTLPPGITPMLKNLDTIESVLTPHE